LVSTEHPFLVHIIPVRRCNLACTYCNEFDDFSPPVPMGEVKKRLDILADMGTSIITISGGEPLLHPELDEIIRHIRRREMIAGMITNGFLLTQGRIEELNDAGLEHLQISIDNTKPDEVSKKSIKTLDQKLELLASYAYLQVNINSVLASGDWWTGVRSSAGSRVYRSHSTRRKCGTASSTRKSIAPRCARFPAYSR